MSPTILSTTPSLSSATNSLSSATPPILRSATHPWHRCSFGHPHQSAPHSVIYCSFFTGVGFSVFASETQAEPDLSMTVNGLHLPNPFVIGLGPPGTNYTMKRAFDEGWGAVIAKTYSFEVDILAVFGHLEARYREKLNKNYNIVDKGYNSFPTNIPGTPYKKALLADQREIRKFNEENNLPLRWA